MPTILYTLATASILLAIAAGLADHRRNRRDDPDAVGWVPWPTVQFLSLLAAALLAVAAFTIAR